MRDIGGQIREREIARNKVDRNKKAALQEREGTERKEKKK